MSRTARWARSPLDYHAHLLLPEGDHPPGVLTARCGAVMTTNTTQHGERPGGLTCGQCRLIASAVEAGTPSASAGNVSEQVRGLAPATGGHPDPGASGWWLSTADWRWHLPSPAGDPPGEVLTARCGAPLRSGGVRNADPIDTARCAKCGHGPDTAIARSSQLSTGARADPDAHPDDEDLDESCPGCGATTGVQQTTATTPAVQTWSCTACGLNWAMFVANPHLRPPHPAHLAAAAERAEGLRATLRQVITLAEDAPTLTEGQLRDRLRSLPGD